MPIGLEFRVLKFFDIVSHITNNMIPSTPGVFNIGYFVTLDIMYDSYHSLVAMCHSSVVDKARV